MTLVFLLAVYFCLVALAAVTIDKALRRFQARKLTPARRPYDWTVDGECGPQHHHWRIVK